MNIERCDKGIFASQINENDVAKGSIYLAYIN